MKRFAPELPAIPAAFICLLLIGVPQTILACDKCFGAQAANTPTGKGISMAMLALLIITACVLASIVLFFVYMARRARMIESGDYIVNEQGTLLAISSRLVEDRPAL